MPNVTISALHSQRPGGGAALNAFPRMLILLLLTLPAFTQVSAQKLDMAVLKGMQPRAVGPAGMSGRVTSIDALHNDPSLIYVGTASGGLWRSTNRGTSWEPLFDDQPVASIGAVAIDQRNPDVLWVGTGEGNPRNSASAGNGMYKSLDGGKSWQHCGLEMSRTIHRVIIHPDNSDIVYVAALGAPWGENPERGVYKTSDGGTSWQKILYIDQKTGAADLVMDPRNPDKLIAAMWEYRRWPWFFTSGGPGSGLYVSFDGGDTWTQRTQDDGLPKGELGRIGLAIAPSNPKRVYALIESKKNALYRSDDGGFTWSKTADKNIGNRPFYYADIFVDPHNDNRLYNLYSQVSVSDDGGKTFRVLVSWNDAHPDHHAWWINPRDPRFIIDGNDGGMAISYDRGESWRFVANLPLAQFYHINVDNELPYHIYGGMQDNGSWRGPAYVWRYGGIRNSYWEEVAFGDGFDVVPDPADARYGYAMWQGGNLLRYDALSGGSKYLRPANPDSVTLRFNWNAAIAIDPFDPATVYYGSQFLHRSTDRGDSWSIISPDLSSNDADKQRQLESGGLTFDVTNAENFTTIVAIAPSPLQPGLLWVGTDDGNVQLSRDAGASWQNTIANIKGVPEGTWVPQIRASEHNAAEAFVVFDNHRRNDWTPYCYHTTDYGRTWRSLVDEDQVFGYVLAILQDPVEPRLLFLGTEFGLYVSIDFGANWTKWTEGFPTVSAMDLAFQGRENDLVVGTFGRAAYVFDDIRPLRALARDGLDILRKPLTLFDIPATVLATYKQASGSRFAGAAEYSGTNRPFGAMLTYALHFDTTAGKSATPEAGEEDAADDEGRDEIGSGTGARADSSAVSLPDSVTISVLADGEVIRSFQRKAEFGINRSYWELNRRGVRYPNAKKPKPGAPEPEGAYVSPGDYLLRISFGDHQDSATVRVLPDPRQTTSAADLAAIDQFRTQLRERVALATKAADQLRDASARIDQISGLVSERQDSLAKALKTKGSALKDSIKTLMDLFRSRKVQGILRDPSTAQSRLSQASFYLWSSYDAMGQTFYEAAARAQETVQEAIKKVNTFFAEEWPTFEQAVKDAEIILVEPVEPLPLE